jgi:hypothetical protein
MGYRPGKAIGLGSPCQRYPIHDKIVNDAGDDDRHHCHAPEYAFGFVLLRIHDRYGQAYHDEDVALDGEVDQCYRLKSTPWKDFPVQSNHNYRK